MRDDTIADIKSAGRGLLEFAPAEDVLRWALERFSSRIALASSFGGPSGMVLLDLVMRMDRSTPVLYVDTSVLFPETYELVENVRHHYGIEPQRISPSLTLEDQSKQFGPELWRRDPDKCCSLRKVLPQREALANYDAWITGLRRDQSPTRRNVPVVHWDEMFGLVKVNPLARWTEDDAWRYIRAHGVPYNALHDRQYPSIGCTHCTAPVKAGEALRAGRWRGSTKTECGLHGDGNGKDAGKPLVASPPENNLLSLGPGGGSKVEQIKFNSRQLRSDLAQDVAASAPHLSDDNVQLIKFHGVYQQEDRDARQARKAAGREKAYQFMVRSAIPGGALTAKQYLAHDALATQFANGTLRITTRQGLQLHGVLKGNLKLTLHAINDALVSTLAACGDVSRNVMACPAPASDRMRAKVQDLANAIAARLKPRTNAYHEIWLDGERVGDAHDATESEPVYGATYLPRKFKIGVAHPGDNCIDAYTQDVALVAQVNGDITDGYTVLIGGGMGSTHGKSETYPRLATPFCFVKPEDALEVVETIVTVQRDFGDRTNRRHARMKYLVEERGIAWFREETEKRLGRRLADPKPVAWHGVDDHLGWHRADDGRWFLGVNVENGRIKDEGEVRLASALRAIARDVGAGFRLTGQQNVLLTGVTNDQRNTIDTTLSAHGVTRNPQLLGIRRDAMACPALPTCGLALADAERALPAVVREIEEDVRALSLGDERISIRMTGCPNGCARPFIGDIGFVGKSKDLYNIYVGGDRNGTRLNALFAESVPTAGLRRVVRPLLERWRHGRRQGESFGDFCHRIGFERLRSEPEPENVRAG